MATSSGTFSDNTLVIGFVVGYSGSGAASSSTGPVTWGQLINGIPVTVATSTTANQYLAEVMMPCAGRLGGMQISAATAGTGAGNTVLDALVNGTSVWTTAADRPTLLATATGSFAFKRANARTLQKGDIITLLVAAISTTGHGRLKFTVAIER